MFVNYHTITVTGEDGTPVDVELRLTVGAQITLKKKYHEDISQIMFSAFTDIEKFVDFLTHSLVYKGSRNTITSGADLYEMLIADGKSGMAARQKLITEIACASGIISESERDGIITKIDKNSVDIFGDNDEDGETTEKN